MTVPILGPLANGTQVIFTIEYDLPASIDESYGDIIITDTLPDGFSWYSTNNSDHLNKIFVGRIQQIVNISYSVIDNKLIIKIPNSILIIPDNQGKEFYAEIDAVISDAASIKPETVLTNNASLAFTGVDLTGKGNTDFMLTPFKIYEPSIPKYPGPLSGKPFQINLMFFNSNNTGNYKYDIMCNFGDNLTFDPLEPGSYGLAIYAGVEAPAVTVTKDSKLSNTYHFIYDNKSDIAGSMAVLTVIPMTYYSDENSISQRINFSRSIQIGGAINEIKSYTFPVYVRRITLRKTVI